MSKLLVVMKQVNRDQTIFFNLQNVFQGANCSTDIMNFGLLNVQSLSFRQLKFLLYSKRLLLNFQVDSARAAIAIRPDSIKEFFISSIPFIYSRVSFVYLIPSIDIVSNVPILKKKYRLQIIARMEAIATNE